MKIMILNSVTLFWLRRSGVGVAWLLLITALGLRAAESSTPAITRSADVVVVGGTPGGIMAAISAARQGQTVLLLERYDHIGGLPANGLGATDGRAGGLFAEFARRVLADYAQRYGAESAQVKECFEGRRFEPSVAQRVFEVMVAEQSRITLLYQRQFDAEPDNATLVGRRLTEIRVMDRATGKVEQVKGGVFIDATYEGDLAAAAGAPYRLGREDRQEFDEPMAGQAFKVWRGGVAPGTTGRGDNAIQSYNYRLPLTKNPANRVPIEKPADYRRADYVSLIDDVKTGRNVGLPGPRPEMEWEGIGRIVNMVKLPNEKTDANNQHAAFISTDLPEENWPWPTSSWQWRDRFAQRLRDYSLGLVWFCQNDAELPADFRARCAEWGLSRDEYPQNGHFPRQVYVREGRRIMGEYLFTAHDTLPVVKGGRPPVHRDSITSSSYNLDSHAVRKREAGRLNLDGIFSWPNAPYTVPYRVIVPRDVEGLLVPVAVSATHIGYSTIRMEPCWMALGEAAGVAASFSLKRKISLREMHVADLQRELLRGQANLIQVRDLAPEHPNYAAVQMLGLRGVLLEWLVRADKPATAADIAEWHRILQLSPESLATGPVTRGAYLQLLWEKISR
ncbi:FAD-dependent oxidoreductase [Oleiharenicola lentus]|uniref:FAD-dependent oxidoreductase n=1 Tax=Oleiharenicola lentus TaxID=2508720 RepID=UPI003F675584